VVFRSGLDEVGCLRLISPVFLSALRACSVYQTFPNQASQKHYGIRISK
jgi:hypothetical protein